MSVSVLDMDMEWGGFSVYKPRAVVRLVQKLGSFAAQIRRASYSQRFAAGKVYGRRSCGEGRPGATLLWDGPGRIRGTNGRDSAGYRTG